MSIKESNQYYKQKDTDKKLAYYNGLSDGLHSGNMAIIAMMQKVTTLNDIDVIKMVVIKTAEIMADISEETNKQADLLLKQVKGDVK